MSAPRSLLELAAALERSPLPAFGPLTVAERELIVTTLRKAGKRKAKRPQRLRCADCGELGKLTGHMECQYPGRVSDPR